jgi:hypothetical protein
MQHHQQEDVLQEWLGDLVQSAPALAPAAAEPAQVPTAAATPGREVEAKEFKGRAYA